VSDAVRDELCADVAALLADNGVFEPADYTPPATVDNPTPAALPCNVCMEFGGQQAGDTATFIGERITAIFLLAEVIPARRGVLVLHQPHRIFGDTFTLEVPNPEWQSASDSQWVVMRGTP